MADPRTSEEVGRHGVQELRSMLDPVRLLNEIRAVQQQLVDIVDRLALGNRETHLADIGGTRISRRAPPNACR
jgi:hypothetical protein